MKISPRKYTWMVLIIALLASVFLSGCDVWYGVQLTNEQALQESGLFGEHQLGKIGPETALNGELHGAYFLLGGAVDGSLSTDVNWVFSWSPRENEYIYSSVPRSKFRTHVDESNNNPVIVLEFDKDWLSSITRYTNEEGYRGGPYPTQDLETTNNFIEGSDNLIHVDIYINSEDLKNEPLLPQP